MHPRLRILLWSLALIGPATVSPARAETAEALRPTLPLLEHWRFHRGEEPGAAAAAFDDTAWTIVGLPHTWNASDGQDGGGNYYRGDGWYRRSFSTPAGWTGKRIYLQFDGANRCAEVFLNGRRLGLHRGGFARFRFEVTDALQAGGANLLAVRVSNAPDDNMIPVSADYTFCGGLYRAVSLVATDPVHVDLLDHASPGVFVRQTAVTADSAELEVQVKLANDTAATADIAVRLTLLDAGGRTVQAADASISLAARARGETHTRLLVVQPHLWNARADPYLYRMRAEVIAAGTVRDAVTLPLGLRFFAVDRARGFSLNGHPLDLHGVNRHQERFGQGWALSEADEREDFAMIEELGATMVRQSHYQQSQLWNDLGDQRGMIMWAEVPFANESRDNPEFFENAKEQLRELIRQNHHHPAILFWSIGNETFVRDPKVMPLDTNERLLRALAAVVREEDPSRLSTYASNGNVAEPRAGAADLLGFNHYFGWYHGAPADFAPWLDGQHALRPDLRIGMSEYGAGANVAQHEESARPPSAPGPWHPEEWQATYHEVYWQALAQRPWVWCKLIWAMFDFASDGRNEGGTPGRNDKGIVTADRQTRKDAFYWYKANWSREPVLYLTSRRFAVRIQPTTTVKVYSNAASVELRINGVSLGVTSSANRIFLWPDAALQPGTNTIEARATIGNRALVDTCTWTYTPATVAPH